MSLATLQSKASTKYIAITAPYLNKYAYVTMDKGLEDFAVVSCYNYSTATRVKICFSSLDLIVAMAKSRREHTAIGTDCHLVGK